MLKGEDGGGDGDVDMEEETGKRWGGPGYYWTRRAAYR
jgi:hypothetical protein